MDRHLLCLFCVLFVPSSTSPRDLLIGIISSSSPKSQTIVETAFLYVNEKHLAGEMYNLTYVYNYTMQAISELEAQRIACEQITKGIVAMIGPVTSNEVKAVIPITNKLLIPLIAPIATDPTLESVADQFLFRMSPSDDDQSEALIEAVDNFQWEKVAILTSDSDYGKHGLVKFQELANRKGWQLSSVQQFSAKLNAAEVDVMEQLKVIKSKGIRVIILHCISLFALKVMKQAESLGMTSSGWAWLSTDGISTTNVFEQNWKSAPLNGFLATRMMSSRGMLNDEFLQFMRDRGIAGTFSVQDRKVVDSILTLAATVKAMSSTDGMLLETVTENQQERTCDYKSNVQRVNVGKVMVEYMRKVKTNGVSTPISFDERNMIEDKTYEVVNFVSGKWKKVAEWNLQDGYVLLDEVILFHENQTTIVDYVSDLSQKTLRIVTLYYEPFSMYPRDEIKPGSIIPEGKGRGHAFDIIRRLSSIIGFNYTFQTGRDSLWGAKDLQTGEWYGMIKDILDEEADMIGAGFTINKIREEVIDYTVGYSHTGMQIIMKKKDSNSFTPFRFLLPFSTSIYIAVLIGQMCISIAISFINKLSPYGHHGLFAQNEHDADRFESLGIIHEIIENMRQANSSTISTQSTPASARTTNSDLCKMRYRLQKEYITYKRQQRFATSKFSFANTFWFCISCLLQQGGENYPRSFSARIPTVIWWMAVMIVVNTYTANLAAFLTNSRVVSSIESVEDLANQEDITYGITRYAAEENFFSQSSIEMYKDMYRVMREKNSMVLDVELGVERVRNTDDYAFIADATYARFTMNQQPCNEVELVGPTFTKSSHGFAFPQNSPYAEEISRELIKLSEGGFIEENLRKWYEELSQCKEEGTEGTDDNNDEEEESDYRIGFDHIAGVFYIMIGGCIASIFILILEWIVFCYIQSKTYNGKTNLHKLRKAFHESWNRLIGDIINIDWLRYFPYCIRPKWQEPKPNVETIDRNRRMAIHSNSNTTIANNNEWGRCSRVGGSSSNVVENNHTSTNKNTFHDLDCITLEEALEDDTEIYSVFRKDTDMYINSHSTQATLSFALNARYDTDIRGVRLPISLPE